MVLSKQTRRGSPGDTDPPNAMLHPIANPPLYIVIANLLYFGILTFFKFHIAEDTLAKFSILLNTLTHFQIPWAIFFAFFFTCF